MTEKKYEDEPIFIEVFERKDGEQEAENWQDNFEVTSREKIVQPMSNYCYNN